MSGEPEKSTAGEKLPRLGEPAAGKPADQRIARTFPSVLVLLVFGSAGICLGLGLWVAVISKAASYLGEDPEACVNCHVMRSVYASWQHSSHREVATCNDCHVPHDSFVRHWFFKARDGLWHATVFTLRCEPQVIRLSARAEPVVEENCRRCHEQQLSEVLSGGAGMPRRCWDCHTGPHDEVQSLSTTQVWLPSR